MKRVVCILLAAVCGCSAEVASPEEKNPTIPSSEPDYSYPSGNVRGPQCPPPLTFTVVEGGKEVTKTITFPCAGPAGPKSPASDPPGWGTDNEGSMNVGNIHISIEDIRHDPTVDPTPYGR